MKREFDEIDREAERIFKRVRCNNRLRRYRDAVERDPDAKWEDAVKRVKAEEKNL